MKPIKIPEVIIDRYLKQIAPKKEIGQPLTDFENKIYNAIQSKFKGDEKTYAECLEAIGRYQLIKQYSLLTMHLLFASFLQFVWI